MNKHYSVPRDVNGLFWHHTGSGVAPVFVNQQQADVFIGVDGQPKTLNDGEYLLGPQQPPITAKIPVRAQSQIKLSGELNLNMTIEKGNCLVSGLNDALSMAHIPIRLEAFSR